MKGFKLPKFKVKVPKMKIRKKGRKGILRDLRKV